MRVTGSSMGHVLRQADVEAGTLIRPFGAPSPEGRRE